MVVQNSSILFGPNTERGRFASIHRLFEERLNEKREVIFNDGKGNEEKIDLMTLNATANRIANYLLNKSLASGFGRVENPDGDYLVGICMQPSLELVVSTLSVLKMGAAYVPINVAHRDQVKLILDEAKPMIVICDELAMESGLFDDFATAWHYRDCLDASRSLSRENISNDRCFDSDIALVLYTSGSTGTPKGARLPHSAFLNRLFWQFQEFPYATTETVGVLKTAFTFLDSVSEMWGALLSGRSLLVLPNAVPRDPSALVRLLDAYKIQRLVVVPSALRSILTYLNLLDRSAGKLKNLNLFVCSGEALSKQLANDFFSYFGEGSRTLCNFYGSTEIMGDVTYFVCDPNDTENPSIPLGRPISNTGIYVVKTTDTSDLQLAVLGEIGELCISGENLARSYVNGRDKHRFCSNPFASNAKHKRLFRTGDFARIGADGFVYYEGRTDSQVKIRGHRIDLSQIEVRLNCIENVRQAVVLAPPTEADQQRIVANVVVDRNRRLTSADIEYVLRSQLPDYMIPEVVVVEDIPLLPNGKIDRQLLLKHYQSLDDYKDTSFDYAGIPDADLEKAKVLFETISEITAHYSHRTLSRDSDFYEIGGDSLNSLYVIALMRDKHYTIDISDFISSTTLAEIVRKMSAEEEGTERRISFGGIENEFGYRSKMLSDAHRAEAIHVVASSFFFKSNLDRYSTTPSTLNDYTEMITDVWQPLLSAGLSFVVLDRDDRIVGAYLMFDAHTTRTVPLMGCIGPLSQILRENDAEILQTLPTDRPFVGTFLMGALNVSPARNVGTMAFMEKEATRIATEKGYAGILTTNISPVTKALGQKISGYRIVNEIQVNKCILNGVRPYARAPDSYTITTEWKTL